MADDLFIIYDPDADEGERLAPEVRTEIAAVAPSAVLNGSITTLKLQDAAVTNAKLAVNSVAYTNIIDNAVRTAGIQAAAVTTAKIADAAVTPAKTTTGVVCAVDNSGTTVATRIMYLTAAQYAAIGSPDSNTLYFIN